jgi:hypothetical protein
VDGAYDGDDVDDDDDFSLSLSLSLSLSRLGVIGYHGRSLLLMS